MEISEYYQTGRYINRNENESEIIFRITYFIKALEAQTAIKVEQPATYQGGKIFAIIVEEKLYFKAGNSNKAEYERAGSEPFRYTVPNGKVFEMAYWELPADILEDRDELPRWMEKSLAVFEGYKIRRHYDEKKGKWYFSVVDIIQVLIQQPDYQTARKYWNKLKERLKAEGSQTVTNCHQLKMIAEDGKMRLTDVADPETLLRLIQSVPSPKAEPITLWLAKVGYERMQDMADPARSLDRAREYWQQHGRSKKWIQQRMMGRETRNKLTDYWMNHDIKEEEEYAILTNIIHREWSGGSVKKHNKINGLRPILLLEDCVGGRNALLH